MAKSGGSLRRSGRRNVSIYKKGDYIEFNLNGGVVTGRLITKSFRTSNGHPIWIVAPSDRRRKNEEVSEEHMGRIIDVDEAMNNKSLAKASRNSRIREGLESTASNSDGEGGGSGEGFGDDHSKKRKAGDDFIYDDGSRSKQRKTVTFQDNTSKSTSTSTSGKKGKGGAGRIGTRSSSKNGKNSSGNGNDLDLLPSPMAKKKKKNKKVKGGYFKGKKGKDEKMIVVKMLTGTLYLFRGERPRAEFVRQK